MKNNETNSENIYHQQHQAAANNPRAFFGRTSTDRGEIGVLESIKKQTYNDVFSCTYQVQVYIIMLIYVQKSSPNRLLGVIQL